MCFVGIVVIGRNEGDRLRRCLDSVSGRAAAVVYVDSGSTDGSIGLACKSGAEVVQLETAGGFSAARARNAGFERLLDLHPRTDFVQFVDGDCQVVEGWLEHAVEHLRARSDVAVVCGRRRERFPQASIYNRLCDMEWDTPPGEAQACGGDAMMRVRAFRACGGFDPTVAAGEEPEFCRRLRENGWRIVRLDAEMTLHDADMHRLPQWWRRQLRGGCGALDLVMRRGFSQDAHYSHMVRSSRIWTIGWLGVLLIALTAGAVSVGWWGLLAAAVGALALPVLQALRMAVRVRSRAPDTATALAFGAFAVLGKWPEMFGQLIWYRNYLAGRGPRLIEYKLPNGTIDAAAVLRGQEHGS